MRAATIRCVLNLHRHHDTRLCDGHRRLVDEQHVATIRVIGRIADALKIQKQLSSSAEVLTREASVAHFLTIESDYKRLRAKPVVAEKFIEGDSDGRDPCCAGSLLQPPIDLGRCGRPDREGRQLLTTEGNEELDIGVRRIARLCAGR